MIKFDPILPVYLITGIVVLMGIYRLLLAMTVIFSHLPPAWGGITLLGNNGGLAVACFFVISGFYMSLIADKYQLRQPSFARCYHFYKSRILRIYPVYYLVMMMTMIAYSTNIIDLVHPISIQSIPTKHMSDKIAYAFSNSFIFGQSLIRFFVYSAHKHYFTFKQIITPDTPNELLGSSYSILGQSWSLSLELCFYALLPFLCRLSNSRLLLITAASFTIRIAFMAHNSKSLLGTDIFFPNTLGLFTLGMISHRFLYTHLLTKNKHDLIFQAGKTLIVLFVTFAAFINLNHNSDNYTTTFWVNWWSFILLSSMTIPFIFCLSKNNKLDREFGELSYPLYMIHLLVIEIIAKNYHGTHPVPLVLAISMFVSYIIYIGLIKPLEAIRSVQGMHDQSIRQPDDKLPLATP